MLTVTNLIEDVSMEVSLCSEAEHQELPGGLRLAMYHGE